jgi:hypothetical protein
VDDLFIVHACVSHPAGDLAEKGPEYVYKAAGVAEQANNSAESGNTMLLCSCISAACRLQPVCGHPDCRPCDAFPASEAGLHSSCVCVLVTYWPAYAHVGFAILSCGKVVATCYSTCYSLRSICVSCRCCR